MPFIPAWFDDLRLDPRSLSIAVHVARRGDCFESSKSIAEHCQIGRNTVLKLINEMVEKGVLEKEGSKGGKSVLRLSLPDLGSIQNGEGSIQNGPPSPIQIPLGSIQNGPPSIQNGEGSIQNGEGWSNLDTLRYPLKGKEVTKEKKVTKKRTVDVWPQILEMEWPGGLKNDPDFVELFKQWVSFRSKLKKITQEPTVFFGRQLKKLSGWGVAGAVASVSKSLECEWQGIFEPDQRTMANGRGKPAKPNDELTAADFLA